MNDSTLPSCVGCYGEPIKPNGPCESCRHAEACRKVIRVDDLREDLADLRDILRGEKK